MCLNPKENAGSIWKWEVRGRKVSGRPAEAAIVGARRGRGEGPRSSRPHRAFVRSEFRAMVWVRPCCSERQALALRPTKEGQEGGRESRAFQSGRGSGRGWVEGRRGDPYAEGIQRATRNQAATMDERSAISYVRLVHVAGGEAPAIRQQAEGGHGSISGSKKEPDRRNVSVQNDGLCVKCGCAVGAAA
jgi:hypothetical protein